MRTRAFFAYGTLEIPEVMRAVTGRRPAREPASLHGFVRALLRGRVYPGAVASSGAVVDGSLYHALDEDAFALLDRFEDDLYERRSLVVQRVDGTTALAEVYVVPDRHRHLLGAEPWQRAAFEREHLPAFLAACERFRRAAVGCGG